jgi:hypothetical protein
MKMEKTMEFVFNKSRYEHLKENLKANVNFVSYLETPDGVDENYIRFSIDITDTLDVLDLYHTGIKFGLGVGLGKLTE